MVRCCITIGTKLQLQCECIAVVMSLARLPGRRETSARNNNNQRAGGGKPHRRTKLKQIQPTGITLYLQGNHTGLKGGEMVTYGIVVQLFCTRNRIFGTATNAIARVVRRRVSSTVSLRRCEPFSAEIQKSGDELILPFSVPCYLHARIYNYMRMYQYFNYQ